MIQQFWYTFGTLLVHFWCTFGALLVHFWYTFGALLVHFWYIFGALLVQKNTAIVKFWGDIWKLWTLVCVRSGSGVFDKWGRITQHQSWFGIWWWYIHYGWVVLWVSTCGGASAIELTMPAKCSMAAPCGACCQEVRCNTGPKKSFKVGEAAVSNDEANILVSERHSILKTWKGYGTQQQDKAPDVPIS